MTRKIRTSSPKEALDKKLAKYALACAAVVVPGVAKADTITYVPNVDVTIDQPGSYAFPGSPFSNDIAINAAPVNDMFTSDPTNQINVTVANGAMVVGTGSDPSSVTPLAFGALIDPTNSSSFVSGGKMSSYNLTTNEAEGSWPTNGTDAYLGFYFVGAGGPQAGWADVATTATASGASFEVLSYAYETVANTPIDAGQTSSTPEPSSMALIALGAAGLIALRRRSANA